MIYRFELKPRLTHYTVEKIDAQGRHYRTQCELEGGFNVEADSPEEGWAIALDCPESGSVLKQFGLTFDDFTVSMVS